MEEDDNRPIGELLPIDAREGRKILKRMARVLAVTSGVAFFAGLLMPTRTAGASRSARLQWQQRQKEIQEVINQCHLPHEHETGRSEDTTSPRPSPPQAAEREMRVAGSGVQCANCSGNSLTEKDHQPAGDQQEGSTGR